MMIGSLQVSILRTVHGGDWFDTGSTQGTTQRACMRLEGRRLLKRDTVSSTRWTSTPQGDALIEKHDDALAAAVDAKRVSEGKDPFFA